MPKTRSTLTAHPDNILMNMNSSLADSVAVQSWLHCVLIAVSVGTLVPRDIPSRRRTQIRVTTEAVEKKAVIDKQARGNRPKAFFYKSGLAIKDELGRLERHAKALRRHRDLGTAAIIGRDAGIHIHPISKIGKTDMHQLTGHEQRTRGYFPTDIRTAVCNVKNDPVMWVRFVKSPDQWRNDASQRFGIKQGHRLQRPGQKVLQPPRLILHLDVLKNRCEVLSGQPDRMVVRHYGIGHQLDEDLIFNR